MGSLRLQLSSEIAEKFQIDCCIVAVQTDTPKRKFRGLREVDLSVATLDSRFRDNSLRTDHSI